MSSTNRREFVGRASLGLFAIIPARVLRAAPGDRPTPSNRVNVALIGTGGMGMGNLGSFLGQPDCQVTAVCDVDATRAAKAKELVDKKYGNTDCRAVQDFRELLTTGGLDAVCQSTPDHWHALTSLLAVEAGLDVYGEKPFTHDLREGRALADAVKRNGRIWQTGSWQRSLTNFRRACELVRNGRVGRIVRIDIGLPGGTQPKPVTFGPPPRDLDYDLWVGPAQMVPYCAERVHYNFRHQFNFGGGKLMDWIGHHGDIAHWAMGCDESGPVEVWGKGEFPTDGIFDAPVNYDVFCRYANGVEMHISNKLKSGVVFTADNGHTLYVDRGKLDANPKSILGETLGPTDTLLYKSDHHQRNFLDGVLTRRTTVTPAEVAHRSASIGHLGNIAMLTGRKLRWDPARETFLGDEGANALLGRAYRPPWHL